MDYLSFAFIAFLTVFVCVYFIVKREIRYAVLFAGSYFFYGYANPKMLIVLICVTAISYVGGLLIEKWKSRAAFVLSFSLEILLLVGFKYTNFILSNINLISGKLLSRNLLNIDWNIVLPIGLSFMVFQACGYLSDVYRGNIKAERNIIRYATFVAFFPTVLSGPIQKARNLLPQLTAPKQFDYDDAKAGTMLFIWGAFEKIMVANRLSLIYSSILGSYQYRSSAEILIGAVCFSLYIYADFSSYSDMARGVSKLLGIDVGKNFNNPYLSQSTSEFWNRWHMSLNEWFVENVYIPLGGNRKGIFRKYVNMLIVFFISGLWHGASWHFVAWGVLNGCFAIFGQILKPVKSRIYEKTKIDPRSESIVFVKRAISFYLITLTWVFFTSGVTDSLKICKSIVLFDFISVFDPALLNVAGTAVATFVTLACVAVFCSIQLKRQDERQLFEKWNRQPLLLQCLPLAIMICVCIFGMCATDANVDTQFLYFQF